MFGARFSLSYCIEIYEFAVKLKKFTEDNFSIKSSSDLVNVNVINLKTEIITEKVNESLTVKDGNVLPSPDKDVWKVAAFDRTFGSTKHTVGFLKNFGAQIGAFASTWNFHENNLIIIGTNEKDMVIAANSLIETQGGMIVVNEGKILSTLPLQLAGIISTDNQSSGRENINGSVTSPSIILIMNSVVSDKQNILSDSE